MWRVLLLCMCSGLFACSEPAPVEFRNTNIGGVEIGGSLAAFKDHSGHAITLNEFKGKAVVVFFGYTSCPDVCPTTLARLAEAMKILGTDAERVQVLMLTVDPEHDTPEKLAAYMTAFNPSFLGLYGDQAATEAAAKAFRVFVRAETPTGHEHAHAEQEEKAAPVRIDHSTGSYVFDPAGKIRLYVRDDASVDAMVSDLKGLLAGL